VHRAPRAARRTGRADRAPRALPTTPCSTAFNISVTDNFPESSFAVVDGSATISIDELAAGASSASTLTLIPKSSGTMTSGRALVAYEYKIAPDYAVEPKLDEDGVPLPLEDDVVQVSSVSTSEGRVEILPPDAYAKKSKQREPGVIVTIAAALALTLGPWSFFTAKDAHAKRA
jgi:hypothetical protein